MIRKRRKYILLDDGNVNLWQRVEDRRLRNQISDQVMDRRQVPVRSQHASTAEPSVSEPFKELFEKKSPEKDETSIFAALAEIRLYQLQHT